MTYEFRDAAGEIIAQIDPETGHVVILDKETGGEAWEAALAAGPASFVPEAEPDPLQAERAAMVVSRLQARAALLEAGLLDVVEKAVNGSTFAGSKVSPLVRLAWNEAGEFRRASPTIAAVGQVLGLTEDQLDELFRAAMRIEF